VRAAVHHTASLQLLVCDPSQRRMTMREVAETLHVYESSESPAAIYPIELPPAIV